MWKGCRIKISKRVHVERTKAHVTNISIHTYFKRLDTKLSLAYFKWNVSNKRVFTMTQLCGIVYWKKSKLDRAQVKRTRIRPFITSLPRLLYPVTNIVWIAVINSKGVVWFEYDIGKGTNVTELRLKSLEYAVSKKGWLAFK